MIIVTYIHFWQYCIENSFHNYRVVEKDAFLTTQVLLKVNK